MLNGMFRFASGIAFLKVTRLYVMAFNAVYAGGMQLGMHPELELPVLLKSGPYGELQTLDPVVYPLTTS